MAAAKACAAGLISAVAAATMGVEHAYADSPLKFSPFSSSPAPSAGNAPAPAAGNAVAENAAPSEPSEPPKPRNDNPRTTSSGFDPEALERGAKAVERIKNSKRPNEVFFSLSSIFDQFYVFC